MGTGIMILYIYALNVPRKSGDSMDQKYIMAGLRLDWLSWIGMPMLYDGGLCVNRSLEEHEYSTKRRGVLTV